MRSLLAVFLGLSVAMLTACDAGTSPSPKPSPAASVPVAATPSTPAITPEPGPVLSIETRGGECATGACSRLVNIEGDGRIHEVIPKDRVVGTVPEEILDALRVEMLQANFNLLQSRPFTGQCPTAFDGQETVYVFHVPTGDEEMASCKVAIDENHPLFRAVAAARSFETP
jgi:hypothetical protein